MERGELSKERDESSFSEAVGHAGVEGECWEVLGEEFDPFCLERPLVSFPQQYSARCSSRDSRRCVFVCPITKLSITRYHESESGSLLKRDKRLLGDHAKTAEDRMELLNLPRL